MAALMEEAAAPERRATGGARDPWSATVREALTKVFEDGGFEHLKAVPKKGSPAFATVIG